MEPGSSRSARDFLAWRWVSMLTAPGLVSCAVCAAQDYNKREIGIHGMRGMRATGARVELGGVRATGARVELGSS